MIIWNINPHYSLRDCLRITNKERKLLMKISKVLLSVSLIGALCLTGLSGTALAWHPKGVITKKVQNITANTALSEADTAAQAVAAKPGDTLKYVIEIRNDGAPDAKGYNDMAKTVMTDALPTGVQLASNPAQRQITENIGLIKPGQKVVKEYLVKVNTSKDSTITNTACFTGDSTANDNPQKGCNPAVIKVTVPPAPEKPQVPVTPTTPTPPETPKPKPTVATPAPVAKEMPVELPQTGPTEGILGVLAIGAVSYALYRYLQSRRELAAAWKANA